MTIGSRTSWSPARSGWCSGALAVELYRGLPEGPVRVAPGPDGSVRCEVLEAGLVTIGGAIRVDWDGGQADVTTT